MDGEINAIQKNQTWELVSLPVMPKILQGKNTTIFFFFFFETREKSEDKMYNLSLNLEVIKLDDGMKFFSLKICISNSL